MANIPLQSITFPGLSDKYTTPTVDATLTQTGAAADAKKTGDEIGAIKNDLSELERTYSAFVVETETDAIASFSDGADDVPVKDLTVAIEPVQSGSGDPSPTNIRPISGWTGANVVNAERLVVLRSDAPQTYTEHGVTWDASRYPFITAKGTTSDATSYSGLIGGRSQDNSLTAGTYTLKAVGNIDNAKIVVQVGSGTVQNIDKNTPEITVTVNDTTVFSWCCIVTDGTTADASFAFVIGSSEYASVDWTTEAGTVYGGTLDVTTGVLTVTMVEVDISTLDYTLSTPANHVFRTDSLRGLIEPPLTNAQTANAICSSFSQIGYSPISASSNGKFAVANKGDSVEGRLIFVDHRYSTIEAFISGNEGTQLVYELATPQTYQLTPQEVNTILGQNNIFADTGNVTVQYRADTKLYIDKVLSA